MFCNFRISKMVMCWAPGCNHYNQRETCRFFKFPTEPKLRARWKQLVRLVRMVMKPNPFNFYVMLRRDAEPGPGATLCSCHFPDGDKTKGPQFFKHNENRRFVFSSPEKKKRFRKTASPQKHIAAQMYARCEF